MPHDNLIRIYEESFRKYGERTALTDYFKSESFTYLEMAEQIARLHLVFEKCGIRKGDKIAIIGRNNIRWVTAYVAVITFGAVVVPVLKDFSPNDINHIINHSEAKLLFLGDQMWDVVEDTEHEKVRAVFSLTDFSCICENDGSKIREFRRSIGAHFAERYPDGFKADDIKYANVGADDVMVLNYTSGTTGFSRGVKLTVENITQNVLFALGLGFYRPGEKVLCVLPLGHIFGSVLDMLPSLAAGAHVTLMGSIPTPKVLVRALGDVRPRMICLVPYIFERVVRREIAPVLETHAARIISKIPGGNTLLATAVKKKLTAAFGHEIEEVIVGGAPLNHEIEKLLRSVGFPVTVGYGMTECAPVISYTPQAEFISGSAGKVVPGMEARVESPGEDGVGEIFVRGSHVMQGYYKNPKGTSAILDDDGWLRTGDMGSVDADGTIYIKGRRESMILIGDNPPVYPEGIESRLDVMEYVMESLVVERGGRLVALVVPDYDQLDGHDVPEPLVAEKMKHNLQVLNETLQPHEQISGVVLYPREFQKTPKMSIKRYIYK